MDEHRNDTGALGSLDALAIADDEAELLLDIAETAIRAALAGATAPDIDINDLPTPLRLPNGAFVTLHVAGRLNGCIGDVAGSAPLAVSVAELAIKAAFHDPRLPLLRRVDLAHLSIEVSLLSPHVEVPAGSRTELLQHVHPDDHGLVLAAGSRRALFLPDVWRQLPRPDDFVDQLLRKAGLPADAWPGDLAAAVFTTTSIHRHLG